LDFVREDVLNKSLDGTKINGQVATNMRRRILKQRTSFLVTNLNIYYEFMGASTAFGLDIESQGFKLQKLTDIAGQGVPKRHIGMTFPVTQLASAHKLQESGRNVGKSP